MLLTVGKKIASLYKLLCANPTTKQENNNFSEIKDNFCNTKRLCPIRLIKSRLIVRQQNKTH